MTQCRHEGRAVVDVLKRIDRPDKRRRARETLPRQYAHRLPTARVEHGASPDASTVLPQVRIPPTGLRSAVTLPEGEDARGLPSRAAPRREGERAPAAAGVDQRPVTSKVFRLARVGLGGAAALRPSVERVERRQKVGEIVPPRHGRGTMGGPNGVAQGIRARVMDECRLPTSERAPRALCSASDGGPMRKARRVARARSPLSQREALTVAGPPASAGGSPRLRRSTRPPPTSREARSGAADVDQRARPPRARPRPPAPRRTASRSKTWSRSTPKAALRPRRESHEAPGMPQGSSRHLTPLAQAERDRSHDIARGRTVVLQAVPRARAAPAPGAVRQASFPVTVACAGGRSARLHRLARR